MTENEMTDTELRRLITGMGYDTMSDRDSIRQIAHKLGVIPVKDEVIMADSVAEITDVPQSEV